MASGPELIYCASGNRRYAGIAIEHGFTYGAQLPGTVYYPPEFADQNWKKTKCSAHKEQVPVRSCRPCAEARARHKDVYLMGLAEHRPRLATVLDLEAGWLLDEVLQWAHEASRYVSEAILLIPKYNGAIEQLPRFINGLPVRLAYSVPTRYGGTAVPLWDFDGWDVHLLGGSPEEQMALVGGYRRLRATTTNQRHIFRARLNVASADGNYAQKMANERCQFWQPGNAWYASNRYWPTLLEADGRRWGDGSDKADAPSEAFRRSCTAIMSAWSAH